MSVRLKLYVGPAVPLPAPPEVIDALVSASVTSASARAPGVFQLVFELDARSPLTTLFLVGGGVSIPLVRVVIAAQVFGRETVLIDGVMTNHALSAGPNPGSTRLTVTGEDLSRVLDYLELPDIRYPAMPDFARVALIVAKYAFLGIIPKVIPSILLDVPLPTGTIPQQQGTDLKYVQKLADDVGYIFMMQPGPAVGMSFAYWGPDLRVGEVQPALSYDVDAHRNVESAGGTFDTQNATLPIVVVQNPETKVPIPIPAIANPLLDPPLGLVPRIPLRIVRSEGAAKQTPIQAALIGMAKAARSQVGASRVSGKVNPLRYGRLLEPHKLVGLQGAGPTYDGIHYVEKVTTNFAEGEISQDYELTRNGVLSTVPKVAA